MSTTPKSGIVSDHALLRWVERVMGSDIIAQARAEILGDGRAGAIPKIGSGRIHVRSLGATLLIRNGLVVTVTKPDKPARAKAVRHE